MTCMAMGAAHSPTYVEPKTVRIKNFARHCPQQNSAENGAAVFFDSPMTSTVVAASALCPLAFLATHEYVPRSRSFETDSIDNVPLENTFIFGPLITGTWSVGGEKNAYY